MSNALVDRAGQSGRLPGIGCRRPALHPSQRAVSGRAPPSGAAAGHALVRAGICCGCARTLDRHCGPKHAPAPFHAQCSAGAPIGLARQVLDGPAVLCTGVTPDWNTYGKVVPLLNVLPHVARASALLHCPCLPHALPSSCRSPMTRHVGRSAALDGPAPAACQSPHPWCCRLAQRTCCLTKSRPGTASPAPTPPRESCSALGAPRQRADVSAVGQAALWQAKRVWWWCVDGWGGVGGAAGCKEPGAATRCGHERTCLVMSWPMPMARLTPHPAVPLPLQLRASRTASWETAPIAAAGCPCWCCTRLPPHPQPSGPRQYQQRQAPLLLAARCCLRRLLALQHLSSRRRWGL